MQPLVYFNRLSYPETRDTRTTEEEEEEVEQNRNEYMSLVILEIRITALLKQIG